MRDYQDSVTTGQTGAGQSDPYVCMCRDASQATQIFVKEYSDSKTKYTEHDIINVLELIVDNIFVVFDGKVLQQIVGISIGTNCEPS